MALSGVEEEKYHVPITEIDKRLKESVEAVARIEEDALLTGIGKNGTTPCIGIVTIAALERRLVRQLLVDLLVTKYSKEYFYMANQSSTVNNPVIIIGAPRTGTTILLELLGLDKSNWRQLKSYEATLPIVLKNSATKAAHGWLAGLEYILDGVRHIHHERWDGPTECRSALENGVGAPYTLWYVLGATTCLDAWLCDKERRFSDYSFYRQQLELLTSLSYINNNNNKHQTTWLLKDPMHTFSLDALFHAFPQATIVWTHRSPHNFAASMCSLLSSVWSRMLRHSTQKNNNIQQKQRKFDSAIIDYLALALKRAVIFRAENPQNSNNFIDISMDDLVQNPMAVIDQIYLFTGKSLAPNIRADMIKYLQQDHARKQRKKHAYQLSDFDLTFQDIDSKFATYTAAPFFPVSSSATSQKIKK
eukprot:CAMPEP_0197321590 /NCGR_PEP_ID=MMETSP0891-20130614/65407_1 /TAXON_ID=44058 ORGANISM="Aureoumbra lagunensis, Strain CCMP1510" /NCGR_SAMPLE_ID=MMETSP0891 /ASSEMBLY_ACC=CAM_ASM_000534 /LENGTH=418 /DNA_ID=CAMNT_0042813539 /DNA_START=175 /DNA_END=1431 /DNA_ORIENTATION=-